MADLYVRVDDRLIHGQTIVAWCPLLGIKEIIAVDAVEIMFRIIFSAVPDFSLVDPVRISGPASTSMEMSA